MGNRSISRSILNRAIASQDHHCIYCQLPFGTVVSTRRGTSILNPVADHFLPWSAGGSGYADNCVACCQRCNGTKFDKYFESIEDVRRHIQERTSKHYFIDFVPTVANTDRPDEWAQEYSSYLVGRREVSYA